MGDTTLGILCFAGPHREAIEGKLKHRWEDFNVFEIDEEGKVIELTEELDRSAVIEEVKKLKKDQKGTDIEDKVLPFGSTREKLGKDDLLNKQDLDTLELFTQQMAINTTVKVGVNDIVKTYYCLIGLDISKNQEAKLLRQKIHTLIREEFPFYLSDTTTVENYLKEIGKEDCNSVRLISEAISSNLSAEEIPINDLDLNSCVIKIYPRPSFYKNCFQKCKIAKLQTGEVLSITETNPIVQQKIKCCYDRWPKNRPDYLIFHLWKCNRDTSEAIQMISRCAHCSPKVFTFAGTKDRRGITVQRICAYKFSIEQLKMAMGSPQWDPHVKVGNCYYSSERLQLGSLQGNFFRICVRKIDPAKEDLIQPAFAELNQVGFINYFGAQRFGSRKIKTFSIGAAIIQQNFKLAIQHILDGINLQTNKEDDLDLEENLQNKISIPDIFEDDIETVKQLEKTLPKHMYIEKIVLYHIVKYPNNYLKILQSLPKQTLTLYIHSVQSLIWNFVASYKRDTYGLQIVEGDFIIPHNSLNIQIETPIVYNSSKHKEDYTIEDVVLPIPSDQFSCPAYLSHVYEKYMQERFNITTESFKALKKLNLGTYKGGFRQFIIKPKNTSLKIISPKGDCEIQNCAAIETEEVDNYTSVLFECSLPKSSYLTMCIRELFKLSSF